MNWGNKLVVAFVLFGALIFYMVYRSVTAQVDLVAKDYYSDEIAYQQVINEKQNTNALSGNTTITQISNTVTISLPEEMKGKNCTGKIYFYSPANEKFDITIPLALDSFAKQQVSTALLKAKSYTVKVSWEATGKKYFFETPLVLQ